MKPYRVAPEAEADLRQIWRYLAEEAGLAVADRIQDELLKAFEGLGNFPGKGHKRSDLTSRDGALPRRVSIYGQKTEKTGKDRGQTGRSLISICRKTGNFPSVPVFPKRLSSRLLMLLMLKVATFSGSLSMVRRAP